MKMCFTGRRPKDLFGYEHDAYIPMVEAIKSCLREHVANGYTEFISGGAQGFDQLAFWAVNALKRDHGYNIKNVVYVPFKGQERLWKETGLFSKKEYNLMLRLADEIVYLKESLTDKKEIVEALHERNHAMVDNADTVFGLYPDNSWLLKETKGGTAECLKYAHSKGKRIYRLSNVTLEGGWVD